MNDNINMDSTIAGSVNACSVFTASQLSNEMHKYFENAIATLEIIIIWQTFSDIHPKIISQVINN
jgi:hypothetical protein